MTKTEQYIASQNGLVTYIRVSSGKHRGSRRGVVVALPGTDGVKFGWSFTNFKAGDIFDKERGLGIAVSRIAKPNKKALVPHEVNTTIARLEERSQRYFKQFAPKAS